MPVERILRLKEDYKPRVNPSQVELTKRDLLLELSPQNPTEGWLLVKLLGDTTAVPCWVPERLVTKDLAGFYRMKRSMQSLYGKGPPDRGVGEVVQVVDTQCSKYHNKAFQVWGANLTDVLCFKNACLITLAKRNGGRSASWTLLET